MAEFYRQLVTEKISKTGSLRQTQFALLKEPWFKHPFYWGAYILVGFIGEPIFWSVIGYNLENSDQTVFSLY